MGPVIILSARQGWHTDQLCRALASRGCASAVLPYEACIARSGGDSGVRNGVQELMQAEGILPRIIPNGSLEQVIFRIDTLHRLAASGVSVMNSAGAIERTVDKAYTSALLEQAGLPTPPTVVCEGTDEALTAFRTLGDVIVKPLFGSMGLGMVRVADQDTAWRVFHAIEMTRGVFYLQRTIEHEGRDVRAFVVGERVIGAIERRASGWKTNVSRGGAASPFDLPEEWANLAVRAVKAVGAEYGGVDLVPSRDGSVYILEVNGIPGWRGLHYATGADAAGAIVDHFLQHVRCRER